MKTPYRERLTDVPLGWPTAERLPDDSAAGDERRARGLRALATFTGDSGARMVEGLQDIAPDLADWVVEFSYGEVMSRPGLDRRSRQLAAVAALTALGTAPPQLRAHIEGALHVGCKPTEIVEVILQMAVYAGFPASINALTVAREVLG